MGQPLRRGPRPAPEGADPDTPTMAPAAARGQGPRSFATGSGRAGEAARPPRRRRPTAPRPPGSRPAQHAAADRAQQQALEAAAAPAADRRASRPRGTPRPACRPGGRGRGGGAARRRGTARASRPAARRPWRSPGRTRPSTRPPTWRRPGSRPAAPTTTSAPPSTPPRGRRPGRRRSTAPRRSARRRPGRRRCGPASDPRSGLSGRTTTTGHWRARDLLRHRTDQHRGERPVPPRPDHDGAGGARRLDQDSGCGALPGLGAHAQLGGLGHHLLDGQGRGGVDLGARVERLRVVAAHARTRCSGRAVRRASATAQSSACSLPLEPSKPTTRDSGGDGRALHGVCLCGRRIWERAGSGRSSVPTVRPRPRAGTGLKVPGPWLGAGAGPAAGRWPGAVTAWVGDAASARRGQWSSGSC